jgi:N-acetylmuramoyl-L-alanine amidase
MILVRYLVLVCAVLWGGVAPAQEFNAIARIDPARSQITDAGTGIEVVLVLSQPVPWRVFTLDEPRRLVLDFREVDWSGATREALRNADRVTDLRFGALRPGWSRLVIDLPTPMGVEVAGMAVDENTGRATVTVRLSRVTEEAFAAAAGAPDDPSWEEMTVEPVQVEVAEDGDLIVVIDPGHGGIDPGAEREGLVEADLMLALGRELAEAIDRTDGMRAVMTRQADTFVPLEARMTIARAARADLFLSLHADALEEDEATGASIYTLSPDASDEATARMAERHDRGDILAGLDLEGQDDTVATILMDLARQETGPAARRLADILVQGLDQAGAAINSRPRREGLFAVLTAADFPAVLIEVGFLSSDTDRELIQSPEGRARIVAGLLRGIQLWAADEAARAPLIRQ